MNIFTIKRDPNNIRALSSSWGEALSSTEVLVIFICSFCFMALSKKNYTRVIILHTISIPETKWLFCCHSSSLKANQATSTWRCDIPGLGL